MTSALRFPISSPLRHGRAARRVAFANRSSLRCSPMSKTFTAEPSTATRRKLALLLLFGMTLGFSGCRTTSDNQIDLLERELRVQEDYIYELEDYVVEYSEKLRTCRSCSPPQTAAYSQEVYEPELESAPKRSKKSKRRQTVKEKSVLEPVEEPEIDPVVETVVETEEDDLPLPADREQAPEISPEDIEVPDSLEFDLEDPVGSLEEAQPLQQVAAMELGYEPSDDGLLFIPDPVNFDSQEEFRDESLVEDLFADEQVEATAALVDRVAERLEVMHLFRSEGDDLSPRNRSPQNLLTVVEALDANGEPVDLDGEISLMVMTTKEANDAAPKRLKRWNFTAEETAAAWQSSDLGDGLHLELPLENLELPAAPLELWVRLVTTDGRKLLTQLPFETSQLSDISTDMPQPLPVGLVMAETQTSEAHVHSIRIETERIPEIRNSELAKSQEPLTDQPRWRASMQRTDHTAEGFASTSAKTTGWITQTPGRQSYAPAQVASAQTISQPATVQTDAPTKPVWTSGRTVLTR